jgi:hypothetical protein
MEGWDFAIDPSLSAAHNQARSWGVVRADFRVAWLRVLRNSIAMSGP